MNKLAKEIHRIAIDKGFWEKKEKNFGEICMLLVSEVSELFEAYRNNDLWENCNKDIGLNNYEEELADIIIRSLDLAAAANIDIDKAIETKMEYNKTRSYKHGKVC